MKHLVLPLAFVFVMTLLSCGDAPKQADPQAKMVVPSNPYSTAAMKLNGPVQTMTRRIYTANIWEETRYEFAPDGHLTTLIQDKSSCGDQMIVRFDDKGAVIDTTYDLSGGCYDPADDELLALDTNVAAQRYTGEYSQATDDYYISAVFNDQGVMTRYHLNDGISDLQMRFFYEADQTTLSEIQYDLVNEDGDLSKGYVIAQKDERGNPTQWAITAPREPFPAEMISMIDEIIPALFIEQASYTYYKN